MLARVQGCRTRSCCRWARRVARLLGKTAWQSLRKSSVELPCDSVTALLGLYPGGMSTAATQKLVPECSWQCGSHRPGRGNSPEVCPSTDNLITPVRSGHTTACFAATTRNEVPTPATTQNFANMMFRGSSQVPKVPLARSVPTGRSMQMESRLAFARGWPELGGGVVLGKEQGDGQWKWAFGGDEMLQI